MTPTDQKNHVQTHRPSRVTVELLRRMPSGVRACDAALKWFTTMWPHGKAPLEEVLAEYPKPEWVVWYACHMLPKEKRVALAYRFAGQACRHASHWNPQLVPYADDVTKLNWRSAVDAADVAIKTANNVAAKEAASYALEAVEAVITTSYSVEAAVTAARVAIAMIIACNLRDTAQAEQVQWCAEALGLPQYKRPLGDSLPRSTIS